MEAIATRFAIRMASTAPWSACRRWLVSTCYWGSFVWERPF